ncbi:MAG: nitroreductase family deazaflavin-dependent oxidoreductase [Halieaceae bacterium]|jgi:deazaflavin-dependent oxidoreductase (nitroreductase family)|nr:nitroreductase family deazaflavin-dependent oxidoreductase [Halieaceae bacterium]MBT6125484.1 nitroreductase family deazaflavin-dependent oxidoreductase [Halieaceae bacterium]
MSISISGFEQKFFRKINDVVEPLVSSGVGSPAWTPVSLIVLESTGFKSGQPRRTPLWSLRLGRYRLISTARGNRSFWVKNLQKSPEVTYSLDGKAVSSDAIVIAPGFDNINDWELGSVFSRVLVGLEKFVQQRGWAFAVLVPADG